MRRGALVAVPPATRLIGRATRSESLRVRWSKAGWKWPDLQPRELGLVGNPGAAPSAPRSALGRGGGVDHLPHFGDLGRRKPAGLGVFADDLVVLGEVDAEGLVVGDIALDPLDVGAELMQHLIGLGGSAPQLVALEGADLGNVPLDDEPAQRHSVLL